MIVLSAATAEFGRLSVDQLLNRAPASDIAVAVRDVHKATDLADRGLQLRYGDYEEPDSLRDSFNGADQLLFISAPSSDSGSGHGSTTTSLTRRGPAALAISSITSGLGADVNAGGLPTTTPVSGPSENQLARLRRPRRGRLGEPYFR